MGAFDTDRRRWSGGFDGCRRERAPRRPWTSPSARMAASPAPRSSTMSSATRPVLRCFRSVTAASFAPPGGEMSPHHPSCSPRTTTEPSKGPRCARRRSALRGTEPHTGSISAPRSAFAAHALAACWLRTPAAGGNCNAATQEPDARCLNHSAALTRLRNDACRRAEPPGGPSAHRRRSRGDPSGGFRALARASTSAESASHGSAELTHGGAGRDHRHGDRSSHGERSSSSIERGAPRPACGRSERGPARPRRASAVGPGLGRNASSAAARTERRDERAR